MRTSWPRWLSTGLLFSAMSVLAVAGLSCVGSSPVVQPLGPKDPAVLSWNQPLTIQWNQAIDDFSVQVTPAAKTRSSVGPGGRIGYVYLDQVDGTTEYHVIVTDAVGANGAHLLEPATFTVEMARRPQLQSSEGLQREMDDRIRLQWDRPMQQVGYRVVADDTLVLPSPPFGGRNAGEVDAADPTVVWINPGPLPQESDVPIRIETAVTQDGAPIAAPLTIAVSTPSPLTVGLDSPDDNGWTPVDGQLAFVFSEPVRDQTAAEEWIHWDPSISGEYEWQDDQTLVFKPESLPGAQKITAAVSSGMDGPRSQRGGFLDQDAAFQFWTAPDKTIDVDLTHQSMTLYEGDQPVRTLRVATGVRGADTPVGQFRVQYKLAVTRFVGINTVSRTRYDIPNVHWVMPFMGDYTIHGAYWRSAFGSRGSNGCVSLSDADAKIVYDWSPPGTLINIHD